MKRKLVEHAEGTIRQICIIEIVEKVGNELSDTKRKIWTKQIEQKVF